MVTEELIFLYGAPLGRARGRPLSLTPCFGRGVSLTSVLVMYTSMNPSLCTACAAGRLGRVGAAPASYLGIFSRSPRPASGCKRVERKSYVICMAISYVTLCGVRRRLGRVGRCPASLTDLRC